MGLVTQTSKKKVTLRILGRRETGQIRRPKLRWKDQYTLQEEGTGLVK
jgi:hypothetical protein